MPTPSELAHYRRLLRRSGNEDYASRIAFGKKFHVPHIHTDDALLRGRWEEDEFDGNAAIRKAYEAEARRAGVNPTGKKYLGGVAGRPKDPRGWVSDASDVRRICRETGRGCRGMMDIKPTYPDEPDDQPYRVADDIVGEEVRQIVEREAGGEVSPRERTELTEQTRERLTGDQ